MKWSKKQECTSKLKVVRLNVETRAYEMSEERIVEQQSPLERRGTSVDATSAAANETVISVSECEVRTFKPPSFVEKGRE